MGSISEFNKQAALGRAAAEKYCKDWSKELAVKGQNLSEQYKNRQINMKTYNARRSLLNEDIKDLNSCVEKINKR